MEIKEHAEIWEGQFGKDYTDRNFLSIETVKANNLKIYGLYISEIFKKALHEIPKDIKILEVGCNIGLRLIELQSLGFKNLYGIDLSDYAVERSKSISKNINIIKSTGFENPFNTNYFDLVFTSGVLVNIDPKNLGFLMDEIYRVSKKYILGFEYYSEKTQTIPYRLEKDFLWKADYSKLYIERLSDLKEIKKDIYTYLDGSGNQDAIFLLEKTLNAIQK
jgi:pseudaminic acid biosynthesis-associated methylase